MKKLITTLSVGLLSVGCAFFSMHPSEQSGPLLPVNHNKLEEQGIYIGWNDPYSPYGYQQYSVSSYFNKDLKALKALRKNRDGIQQKLEKDFLKNLISKGNIAGALWPTDKKEIKQQLLYQLENTPILADLIISYVKAPSTRETAQSLLEGKIPDDVSKIILSFAWLENYVRVTFPLLEQALKNANIIFRLPPHIKTYNATYSDELKQNHRAIGRKLKVFRPFFIADENEDKELTVFENRADYDRFRRYVLGSYWLSSTTSEIINMHRTLRCFDNAITRRIVEHWSDN